MPTGSTDEADLAGSRVADVLRALDDQLDKYRSLEALRRGEPGRTEERRDAMRAVAARFPGALREWEGASAQELARRRGAVEEVAARLRATDGGALGELGTPELAWLRWTLRVQEALRVALEARRSAGAQARGIRGARISAEVHCEVARHEGVSVETLKAALFPAGSGPAAEDDA